MKPLSVCNMCRAMLAGEKCSASPIGHSDPDAGGGLDHALNVGIAIVAFLIIAVIVRIADARKSRSHKRQNPLDVRALWWQTVLCGIELLSTKHVARERCNVAASLRWKDAEKFL